MAYNEKKGKVYSLAAILLVLSVVIFFASIVSIFIDSTGDDQIYSMIKWLSPKRYNVSENICYYPGCNAESHCYMSTDSVTYTSIGVRRAVNLALKVPNEAGLKSSTRDFERDITKDRVYYDKGTYLVPQGDGSLKIENKTNKYEYQEKVGTVKGNSTSFYGYYCKDHMDIAKTIWKNEVETALRTTNVLYWLSKYGYWMALAIFASSATVFIVAESKKSN